MIFEGLGDQMMPRCLADYSYDLTSGTFLALAAMNMPLMLVGLAPGALMLAFFFLDCLSFFSKTHTRD